MTNQINTDIGSEYDPESELRQMRAGVDALSEGFALFNNLEELVYCNTAFQEIYSDLSAFLIPGLSWTVFLLEAKRRHGSAGLDQLDAHLASGIDAPLTLEACNRGHRWLRMGIQPADDGGFVLTETDVTDQHQAHEIIEHADDLLRNILDACASRIVLCSLADGAILYRTPAWQTTFGISHRIQNTFADPVSYTDLLTDILSTRQIDDIDHKMLRATGSVFPARLSARMIDYQGESAMVISAEDMTQLHTQRDEIIRTNRRMLDAIEALDQGFVLFDDQHKLLMANKRYLDINKDIINLLTPGTPNSEIVEHASSTGHEPLAAGWPRDHDENVNARYEFELGNSSTYSASRQRSSDGGFVIAWRDVTEQKATEQELASRKEAAFQNEKLNALGQLLAGVAHELNNPLSVVVGHAMMLADEIDDPEALEGINKISRSAERCAKIVKTFLAMARQKPAQLVVTDLNSVIELALEIASYGMRQNGIVIELNLAPDLPTINIDEDQVTQVFINLLINAEHALSSVAGSARLRISTQYDSTRERLIALFSDNGPGVPDDQKLRIFEPFYTTKAVGEGTGVGLALSHRIIDSHGGELHLADSEIGGATFAVSFPTGITSAISLQSVTSQIDSAPLRALLVEDEADVSDVMQKLLTRQDVNCTVANSAENALSILDTDRQFDLILCDLRMPGMGGRAMLAQVEKRWPELATKFIFVTGDAMSQDATDIRQSASQRLLEKPVSPKELKLLIESLHKPASKANT